MKKFNKLYKIVCFLSILFQASSCNGRMLQSVPFSLSNEFCMELKPSLAMLVKSVNEFDSFLKNNDIFKKEFNEEFIKENSKYDEKYFLNNDLIALIVQATSGSIKGYKLKSIEKNNNSYDVYLESIANKHNVTDDMGGYFCYYLSVDKDKKMSNAKISW